MGESAGQDSISKRKTSSTLQLSSSTSFSSSAHNSLATSASHIFHAPHLSSLTHTNANPAFRRSMPPHMEDSDGNNADDDSVNSFNIGGNRSSRLNHSKRQSSQYCIPDIIITSTNNYNRYSMP